MPLWPWWLGAFAFAAVALLHVVVLRRPLGVSGLLRTATSPEKWREERDVADDAELQKALEEATRRAFGGTSLPVVGFEEEVTNPEFGRPAPSLTWSRSVLFLAGLVIGGAVAGLMQADRAVELLPHGHYERVFGPFAAVALLGGGVLVGFGTAMSGGCTSGHGLVGVARLQPASLIATACFFGIGIALTLGMQALGLGAP